MTDREDLTDKLADALHDRLKLTSWGASLSPAAYGVMAEVAMAVCLPGGTPMSAQEALHWASKLLRQADIPGETSVSCAVSVQSLAAYATSVMNAEQLELTRTITQTTEMNQLFIKKAANMRKLEGMLDLMDEIAAADGRPGPAFTQVAEWVTRAKELRELTDD